MPVVILVIAVLLLFAGLNNQLPALSALIKDDWEPSDGSVSFGVWILAIIIVAVLGYAKALKPFSNAFLVLIFVAIMLANNKSTGANGFFTNLFAFFQPKTSVNDTASANTNGEGSSSTGPSLTGSIAQAQSAYDQVQSTVSQAVNIFNGGAF